MSVINKMLNDLDNRAEVEETTEDVAFLQPPASQSKKRLVMVVIALVTACLAAFVGYWYAVKMPQDIVIADMVNKQKANSNIVKPKVITPPVVKSQPGVVNNSQQSAPTTDQVAEQASKAAATKQPELIVLPKIAESQSAAVKKPTLSVQATAVQQPVVTSVVANNAEQPNIQKVDIKVKAKTAESKTMPTNMQVKRSEITAEQRGEKKYQEAQKLSRQGMIKQAIEKYRNALQLSPGHIEARLGLAALYFGREKPGAALVVLDKGLALDGDNVRLALLAAKIHYKQQHYAGVVHYLSQSVDAGEQIEYVALKATSLQQLRRFSEAAEQYLLLTAVNPGNGRWWLGLGTAYEGQGDKPAATAAYEKSLGLSNISQNSRQYVMSRLRLLKRQAAQKNKE